MQPEYGQGKCREPEKDYQCNTQIVGRGLGSSEQKSETARSIKDEILDTNSSWRNKFGEDDYIGGQTDPKKIASQLRELQKTHLEYIDSNQQDLETRLNETIQHRKNFIDSVERLEKQIAALVGDSEDI